MHYRWTHWPSGKTGVNSKTYEKADSEGGHFLIGCYRHEALYAVLIEHWNGLGGGHWKYELIPEPVVPAPIPAFVHDWVI